MIRVLHCFGRKSSGDDPRSFFLVLQVRDEALKKRPLTAKEAAKLSGKTGIHIFYAKEDSQLSTLVQWQYDTLSSHQSDETTREMFERILDSATALFLEPAPKQTEAV